MSSPEQTVTDFLAMWNRAGGFEEAVRRYFMDDTVYENVGFSETRGAEPAAAFAAGFTTRTNGGFIEVETLAQSASGGTVLNERIDRVIDGDGRVLLTIRVMGVFEVADGRIAAWRDYFDPAPLKAAFA